MNVSIRQRHSDTNGDVDRVNTWKSCAFIIRSSFDVKGRALGIQVNSSQHNGTLTTETKQQQHGNSALQTDTLTDRLINRDRQTKRRAYVQLHTGHKHIKGSKERYFV